MSRVVDLERQADRAVGDAIEREQTAEMARVAFGRSSEHERLVVDLANRHAEAVRTDTVHEFFRVVAGEIVALRARGAQAGARGAHIDAAIVAAKETISSLEEFVAKTTEYRAVPDSGG